MRRSLRDPDPWAQGTAQWSVINRLTPTQRDVVNRLLGDLLWRYGFTAGPVYQIPPGATLPIPDFEDDGSDALLGSERQTVPIASPAERDPDDCEG
jgi:hypothetical protein